MERVKSVTERGGGAIHINSVIFGDIEVAPDSLIAFSHGLVGFYDVRRFFIRDFGEGLPFKWLHAVDVPDLSFVIADPLTFEKDYHVTLRKSDLTELGPMSEAACSLYVILTMHKGEPSKTTANLKAPVIINTTTMRGKQVVLTDKSYQLQHPLFK
ncbi:MAG: flagellar assembly protein FliW [Thermodesulfobacteriota bacterium]